MRSLGEGQPTLGYLSQVWEHIQVRIQALIQVLQHIRAHIRVGGHIQALVCALSCPGSLPPVLCVYIIVVLCTGVFICFQKITCRNIVEEVLQNMYCILSVIEYIKMEASQNIPLYSYSVTLAYNMISLKIYLKTLGLVYILQHLVLKYIP